jgi:SNF2 family DNA or RNA helicase
MLVAPVYADVCTAGSSVPVELQRTADDWLKLVFSTPQGSIEKDAACVNSYDGCRCDFVRLLRALMVVSERDILTVIGEYVMTQSDRHSCVATLELSVKVHRHAKIESLGDFHMVLCHLQIEALAIEERSETSREEAKNAALVDATCSSCRVVGCRLHSWQADDVYGPKSKLHLPDVFQSLMTHMEAEQLEATFVRRTRNSGQTLKIIDLPMRALHLVVCLMGAKELANLSGVCSLFRHLAYQVVPGLNLELYKHQRKALKWMLYRETPSLIHRSISHPFLFPRRPGHKTKVAIDLLDWKVVEHVDTTARDTCGGMFCDEPGLGKTITMLALILQTKGQFTLNARAQEERAVEAAGLNTGLRSMRARDRTVAAEDLVRSSASLIVVPDPLVEHWKYQIEAHVATGALKTFIDEGSKHLPSNAALATYDVVVTSFSRLAKEWQLHRPASALEKKMPERYGFGDQLRYTDGRIRGEVSSLLTVHWVRVIVDEGHKLGGQTPTNLMLMARIISAERRWIMTGTPTPNTLQSADLRFMHGLLVFLRNKPFGQPDGRAWTKAIAKPFEQNQPVGFYRLQSLLSRIMMRHTKASIREILPDPIRHTVYIDPTPSEYAQYNVVAAAVRANLVITSIDPNVPGKLHPDSLLNPVNRKEAMQVVTNLRFACCGGVKSEVVLSETSLLETISMLTELNVDGDNIATVMKYLRRVTLPGKTTRCGSCMCELQLLMILPCGHLCCADCVEDRLLAVGPSCFCCNEVFDPEVLQELQPGFDFQEHHDASRSNQHLWTVDASKIFYAVTRIRQLKKEFAHRNTTPGDDHSKRARYVKVIIFSQFTEVIWRTKLAFEQQKIPTANFITLVTPKERMKALKRFRADPALNVLLLSEMGSHGLDLSFVTHVFLMEEIWDKSLEQQVVSRAHRMGANQAVVVEQLWMRGSVESEMAKVNELDEGEEAPPREIHDLAPPVRTRKRQHTGGNTLLNVAGKKKRKRNRRGDSTEVLTRNKSEFIQRKLDYVLNHLRLLDRSLAAEPGEVRFSVVDESDGTTIHQATDMVRSSESPAEITSLAPIQQGDSTRVAPQRTRNLASSPSTASATQAVGVHNSNRRVGKDAAKRGSSSAVSLQRLEPQTSLTRQAVTTSQSPITVTQPQRATQSAPPAVKRRAGINPLETSRAPNNVTKVEQAAAATAKPAPSPAAAVTARSARPTKPSVQRPPDPQDVIIIDDDDPPATQPEFSLKTEPNEVRNSPEVIVIDSDRSSPAKSEESSSSDSDVSVASSSSCSADNEDHFGSDDSDESDEVSKALLARLVHVAQHRCALHSEPPPNPTLRRLKSTVKRPRRSEQQCLACCAFRRILPTQTCKVL